MSFFKWKAVFTTFNLTDPLHPKSLIPLKPRKLPAPTHPRKAPKKQLLLSQSQLPKPFDLFFNYDSFQESIPQEPTDVEATIEKELSPEAEPSTPPSNDTPTQPINGLPHLLVTFSCCIAADLFDKFRHTIWTFSKTVADFGHIRSCNVGRVTVSYQGSPSVSNEAFFLINK